MIGYIDIINSEKIAGWAIDEKDGSAPPIDIIINNELFLTIVPDQERLDVRDIIKYHGNYGFSISIDQHSLPIGDNKIKVVFSGTGALLTNGQTTIAISHAHQLIPGLCVSSARSGLWHVIEQSVKDDLLSLSAFAIDPPGVKQATLLTNGDIVTLTERIDDGARARFGAPQELRVRRLVGTFRFPANQETIRVSFGSNGASFNPYQDLLFVRKPKVQPDGARMIRVAGTADTGKFETEGASTAKKIESLYKIYCGKPLSTSRVLDWGVGCGRIARYLAHSTGHFAGVDIDADNIRWCHEHLRGDFYHIPSSAPLPFENQSIDLVYGISVLPHLSREDELFWLQEIGRILSPGGIAIITTLGCVAMMIMGRIAEFAETCLWDGRLELGVNNKSPAYDNGEYRNVAHGWGYVREVWGEFFEIVGFQEAIIGNLQDAIVLKRRA